MSKSNSDAFLLLFCRVYFHHKEAVKAFKSVVLNLSTLFKLQKLGVPIDNNNDNTLFYKVLVTHVLTIVITVNYA